MTAFNFEPLKIIGKGAFGEVRLCRNIENQEIVAIKKMIKQDMLKKNQVAHIKAERDILAISKNEWIVDLKFAFQDDFNLYLVMEYLPGGDLMTLLQKKDILTEKVHSYFHNSRKLNFILQNWR